MDIELTGFHACTAAMPLATALMDAPPRWLYLEVPGAELVVREGHPAAFAAEALRRFVAAFGAV